MPIPSPAQDFSIPFSVGASIIGGLIGGICFMFRMVIAAHAARVADLLEANATRAAEQAHVTETLAADGRRAWAIVDRVTKTRVLEIGAFPHVSPQIREEAKSVCDEINEAQAESKRRGTP